jgi:hypothetical protein
MMFRKEGFTFQSVMEFGGNAVPIDFTYQEDADLNTPVPSWSKPPPGYDAIGKLAAEVLKNMPKAVETKKPTSAPTAAPTASSAAASEDIPTSATPEEVFTEDATVMDAWLQSRVLATHTPDYGYGDESPPEARVRGDHFVHDTRVRRNILLLKAYAVAHKLQLHKA